MLCEGPDCENEWNHLQKYGKINQGQRNNLKEVGKSFFPQKKNDTIFRTEKTKNLLWALSELGRDDKW